MKSLFSDLFSSPKRNITDDELSQISSLAQISQRIFQDMRKFVIPGISTDRLGAMIIDLVLSAGQGDIHVPFLHFNVNEYVYHNPPDAIHLCSGDILTVDMVLEKDGYYSDGAWTYGCGEISSKDQDLVEISWQIACQAVKEIHSGRQIHHMQKKLEKILEKTPYAILPQARGHGVGLKVHDEPEICFSYEADQSRIWEDEWLFTVEPVIISRGETVFKNLSGKYVTAGATRTSYFEHMIYLHNGKTMCLNIPEIKMLDSIDIFKGFI